MVKKFLLVLRRKTVLRPFFLSINTLSAIELGVKVTPAVTVPLDDSRTMGKGLAYSGILNTDVNFLVFFHWDRN